MGFGDAFLTALMSATMAAAVFYYTGSELLRTFGLPSDTTMLEFHKFMTGRWTVRTLLRVGLVSLCAVVSAAATLCLVLFAVLKMEPSLVTQKMSLDRTLYIFPVLILAEFYCFMNDFLVYLSKQHVVLLDFDLSEIRFTYDLDARNTAIPLRNNLLAMYPITLALLSLGYAVAIFRAWRAEIELLLCRLLMWWTAPAPGIAVP
jgi:hypothetical protein